MRSAGGEAFSLDVAGGSFGESLWVLLRILRDERVFFPVEDVDEDT